MGSEAFAPACCRDVKGCEFAAYADASSSVGSAATYTFSAPRPARSLGAVFAVVWVLLALACSGWISGLPAGAATQQPQFNPNYGQGYWQFTNTGNV